jgi:hypothetical protein
MPSLSPYEGINELVEAAAVDQANDLLKAGYVLIKVIEKTNVNGSTSIVYVLGRSLAGTQERGKQGDQVARALEGLKWTPHKSGGGEWAFYNDATGNILDVLKPATEMIKQMKADPKLRLKVGEWMYGINGRFLNRYPAKEAVG